ncbi:MAG: phosphoglucosamine mutase [Methanosarcinales archaeon]
MKLFGTSGIRGIANQEVTPDLALKVGLAVGSLHKSVVIGRDPRISSEMIEHALISGLLSSGCDVTKIGIVTTPTLAHCAKDYDCGLMVTASHNPSEYIGIKFWNSNGIAFNSAQQNELESIIKNHNFKRVDWNKIGNIFQLKNAIFLHKDIILNKVNSASLKVVVDCGCGAGSILTPYVLREIGCEVITLNAQLDGHFPARNPEPNNANLGLLKKSVIAFKADLGIAHDGDADRMMAVSEDGRFVSGDELLALFGAREAKNSIVVPIDTSRIVSDYLKNIKIIKTRVGDVYVAEELKQKMADFGGEPSGSWIFPKISYCPDGIYAAARLSEILDKEGVFSDILKEIPEYPNKRGTVKCDNSLKEKAMEELKNNLKDWEYKEINTIDGIRLDFEDGFLLVRPSGTEPKIRITVEAQDHDRVNYLYKLVESSVKKAVK